MKLIRLLPLVLCAALIFTGCEIERKESQKNPQLNTANTEKTTCSPAIMVEGKLYFDTGEVSEEARCGMLDGEITDTVPAAQLPTENGQSNFGKCGYQIWKEGRVDVLLDGKWHIFKEEQSDTVIRHLWIVDGAEEGVLTFAGEKDVYTLDTKNSDVTVYLDGAKAELSDLRDGMCVDIKSSKEPQMVYPMIFTGKNEIYAYSYKTEENPYRYYDLCGLYLKALEEIWENDKALNDSIQYISVDLSRAPGQLTEGQRAAVAWIFAARHQAEGMTLTYEQLKEGGYLTEFRENDPESGNEKLLHWEDGLLFTVAAPKAADNADQIIFNVSKWRSPLGALYLQDCEATWNSDGTWKGYTVGTMGIS